jgi:hypothetical protein
VIKPAIADAVVAVPSGAATDAIAPARTGNGLKRLIWVGTALSFIAIADLALVVYLHYLSHLGVFLPEA